MNYIIADPDEQSGNDLRTILDGYELLKFQGSYTTLELAEHSIRRAIPDVAFIRIGKPEMNAFMLTGAVRELNPISKVIFLSNNEEYAVDAFEYAADGFLLIPFERGKIEHLLLRIIEKRKVKN